jgi:signal transduction histidine kinase
VLARIVATQVERDRELAARIEAEKRTEELYLAQQEAVREREALIAIASHELKNPLAALLVYAHVLKRRMSRDQATNVRDHEAIEAIVEQGERLNGMLGELLDISRLDRDQFTIERVSLDFAELVQRVVADMRPMLEAHTAAVMVSEQPLLVSGDRGRLAQVVHNLLTNAVKYSPAGGRIELRIDHVGDQACLSVRDEGIGIPASALPHLFQRFYRAANGSAASVNGLGIGLYVVKEILTRHGGSITVDSCEGQGSTFTVCLPVLQLAA